MIPLGNHRLHRGLTRFLVTSGRVGNAHFFLTADSLMMLMDASDLKLLGAVAEGHVEVHMLGGGRDLDYVVHAASAVYQSKRRRLVLDGWSSIRENGVVRGSGAGHKGLVLPTDGSFFDLPLFSACEALQPPGPPGTGPAPPSDLADLASLVWTKKQREPKIPRCHATGKAP